MVNVNIKVNKNKSSRYRRKKSDCRSFGFQTGLLDDYYFKLESQDKSLHLKECNIW